MTLGSTNTPIEGSEIDVPSLINNAVEHISLDGSGGVSFPNGDLTDGTNTIYDSVNSWVPQARLENDSLTITTGGGLTNGGTVSLGSSTTIDVDIGRGLELDGTKSVQFDEDVSYTFTSPQTVQGNLSIDGDGVKTLWGDNQDFSIFYENSTDELVVYDETNSVELIRQPKAGSTQFLQGIDVGSLETVEDTFSQLGNTSVTSALTAGTRVGYSFALDNQTFFAVDGEADGAGGIQNVGLTDGTNTIYDSANSWIPQARLENDSITVNAGTNLTGGGTVALGGSITLNVDETGLDADTLDTLDSTQFLRSDTSQTFTGGVLEIDSSTDPKLQLIASDVGTTAGTAEAGWNYIEFQDGQGDRQGFFGIDSSGDLQFNTSVSGGGLIFNDSTGSLQDVWHSGNDGSGSGLDADTLDGREGDRHLLRTATIPLQSISAGSMAVGLKHGVPSDKTVTIYEVGISNASNSTQTGLDIVAYDDTNSVDIHRTDSFFQEGEPLATEDQFVNVEFRVENNTGGSVTASGYVVYTME